MSNADVHHLCDDRSWVIIMLLMMDIFRTRVAAHTAPQWQEVCSGDMVIAIVMTIRTAMNVMVAMITLSTNPFPLIQNPQYKNRVGPNPGFSNLKGANTYRNTNSAAGGSQYYFV